MAEHNLSQQKAAFKKSLDRVNRFNQNLKEPSLLGKIAYTTIAIASIAMWSYIGYLGKEVEKRERQSYSLGLEAGQLVEQELQRLATKDTRLKELTGF